MWTGSSGPYRPAQPGQSTHATWASGIGTRPTRQSTPVPGPAAYLDPHQHHGHAQQQQQQQQQQRQQQQEQQQQQQQQAQRQQTQSPQAPQSNPPTPNLLHDGVGDGPPEPPKSFPELEAMPLKDLRVLHDEKAKFEDFVSKHKYQKMVDEFVAGVRMDVEAFQRKHEAITSKMDEVVDEEGLGELRAKIDEMEEEVKGLQMLKDEWMEHNAPERLMERLRIAIAESVAISEGLEKSMLSSSMSFDEFLAQYITCRKKYHERTMKLEQLKKETRKRSIGR